MTAALRPVPRLALVALTCTFLLGGLLGARNYIHDYEVYRGFPPPTDPPGVAAGAVRKVRFYSPSLHRRDYVVVYTPPGYAAAAARGARFPVLYLLHAPVGHPENYFNAGGVGVHMDVLLQRRLVRPFLIAVPYGRTHAFGSDTEWANARAGRFEGLVLDAVRAVDRHLSTVRNRSGRAIGGLSMGAYGGANITLHHLRVFGTFESWSGYFTQTPTGPFQGLPPAVLRANSPALVAPRELGAIRRLGLHAFVYQGSHDDVSLPAARRFVRELRAGGASVRFAVFPGKHNWRLWREHLYQALEYADQAFHAGRRR